MAIRDIFKVSRKTFFNPAAWFDLEGWLFQHKVISDSVRDAFTKDKPEHSESFNAAKERLGLSEKDIEHGAAVYYRYAWLFILCGLLIFFYSFHLLFLARIPAWILGMGATALCWAQAFKYHFWSLQMRKRRLGLTYKDWKNETLGKQRNTHD